MRPSILEFRITTSGLRISRALPYFRYLLLCLIVTGIWTSGLESSYAQTGNCPRSQGEAYLDAGNVRARILNNGALFYRGEPHVYEVPKGSGSNAIFATSMLVAGKIGDEVRATATTYGEWEMWPGPIDEAGNPPADCSEFDRLWEIRREDIEAYIEHGEVSANLTEWPWQLGAPVIDGDGDPSNYNLAGGDLPELLGDQHIWWVMNDRSGLHVKTDSEPLGLEVQASAFAFANRGPMDNFTFYRYRLINKNTSDLNDAYFGFFVDPDMGDFADDFIGSDSLLHLAYVYNADNEDEGVEGYGTAPPALGYTFLNTPLAESDSLDNDHDGQIDEPSERTGMRSFWRYSDGGGVYASPFTARDYHTILKGFWKSGEPFVKGGHGFAASMPAWLEPHPTKFFYSGDPVTKSFWTEFNFDDRGTALSPGDRSFITSTGPFDLAQFDSQEITFAIVWSRGSDHLDSVRRLKSDVAGVRSNAETFFQPTSVEKKAEPYQSFPLGFDQNHPNPFTESTTLRYSLPEPLPVRLSVYDVLGREVAVLVDAAQEPGIYSVDFDARGLPAGLYIARIQMGFLQYSKRMVKR